MNTEILGLGWKKFKDNLYPFFSENSWIILLWGITAVMDAYSTSLFMQVTGPEGELHPLTKACAAQAGIYAGPYISGTLKFLMALPLLVCYKRAAKYVLGFGCVFQFYAYHYNVNMFEFLASRISPEFWFM